MTASSSPVNLKGSSRKFLKSLEKWTFFSSRPSFEVCSFCRFFPLKNVTWPSKIKRLIERRPMTRKFLKLKIYTQCCCNQCQIQWRCEKLPLPFLSQLGSSVICITKQVGLWLGLKIGGWSSFSKSRKTPNKRENWHLLAQRITDFTSRKLQNSNCSLLFF